MLIYLYIYVLTNNNYYLSAIDAIIENNFENFSELKLFINTQLI